jgi:DNA-binding transcriptional LysR family regulator
VTEPESPGSTPPRYSSRPFPSSRFVPGRAPHPRRTNQGHSYAQPEPQPSSFPPEQWQHAEAYRYGIDLYNHGYWWESHEVFEALWNSAGRRSEQGNFFQALIQLAAANLKLCMGNRQAAQNLLRRGLVRLERVPDFYMGMNVARLTEDVRQRVNGPEFQAPLMCLIGLKRIG